MDLNSIVNAAQARLKELRKELSKLDFLREEEQKLARLLDAHGHPGAAVVFKPSGRKARGKGGRPQKTGGKSILAVATTVLRKYAGTTGMTIKEILERMRKSNPGRFNKDNASAALSSSLSQAMRAKSPVVKVLKKGGPGRPAKYGAAGASPATPRRKAKAKGGRPAKAGGPSKLALAAEVLRKSKEGMTITEMLERLRKSHADQFRAKHANKMLANALREELKSKSPKVRVLAKGGRGKAATYGAAA